MVPFLQPVIYEIGYSFRSLTDIEGTLGFGDLTFVAGQGTVHTLSKVAQAWTQVRGMKEMLRHNYAPVTNSPDFILLKL